MFTKQMMKYIFIILYVHIARPAVTSRYLRYLHYQIKISKSLALFSIWQIRRTGEQVYTIADTNVT